MPSNNTFLKKAYEKLYQTFGPQNWWPASSAFEVMVGAILTQNTNWKNVEQAIANLKLHQVLEPEKLLEISEARLAEYIKPAGYFNIKTRRLKNFLKAFKERWNFSVDKMKKEPLDTLRMALLEINGIGPETADSIILYALEMPVFVVDAYTKRILKRHGIVDDRADYEDVRRLFECNLSKDIKIFKEYHALIVETGKRYCRKRPICQDCPLREFLPQSNKDMVSTT